MIHMQFLRFLYRNEVYLTEQNLVKIHEMAHFYDLPLLERECEQYVLKIWDHSWTNRKFMTICNRSFSLFNEVIQKLCLSLINNELHLLNTERLYDLTPKALDLVMMANSNDRQLEPVKMFKALLRWGRAHKFGKHLNLDDGKTLREFIENRLKFVRFKLMSPKEFSICMQLVPPGFFSPDEISAMQCNVDTDSDNDDSALGTEFNQRRDITRRRIGRKRLPNVLLMPHKSAFEDL